MPKARLYNVWAGNPTGVVEDTSRCIDEVRGDHHFSHQCYRKRGFGPQGLYCRQHDPATVRARETSKVLHWKKKEQMHRAPYLRAERYRRLGHKLAKKILDGNCPCSCQSCIAAMAYARKLLKA